MTFTQKDLDIYFPEDFVNMPPSDYCVSFQQFEKQRKMKMKNCFIVAKTLFMSTTCGTCGLVHTEQQCSASGEVLR